MFCDTEIKNRCLLHDNDEIFYVDNNHLSKAGNEKILRVVLDKLEKIELKNQKRPSISSLLFNFILLEAGSLSEARNKGWLRSEGKEYIVNEGDVMEFLFNV